MSQHISQSVFFNDQLRATLDHSKNGSFFHQNKNITKKHHIRIQSHYSEDETTIIKINNVSIQISKTKNGTLINQILSINQIFSNYIHETNKHDKQDITQQKYNIKHSYNNFQSQNAVNTQNYQPTQMQNEIPLPYYLQNHEITKTHFTNVSKIPNAA